MKKKILSTTLFSFFIFLFSLFSLHASPYDLILTEDPILEDIRFISLESGIPFLFLSPPLTISEIKNFLDMVDADSLSDSAQKSYSRIIDRLYPHEKLSIRTNNFTFLLGINTALGANLRFQDNNLFGHEYVSLKPLLSLPARFYFSNFVQLYIEPVVNVKLDYLGTDIYDLNFPVEYSEWNTITPTRAFMAIGNDWLNFHIGRDKLYWSNAFTGNLIFNDKTQYYDFARLSFISPNFKYSTIVVQLPLYVNNVMGNFNFKEEQFPNNGIANERYLYLHNLEVLLFKKLNINIIEGVIVGDSPLSLRYLNPLVLFHALFSWEDYKRWKDPDEIKEGDMTGSFFSLQFNFNIFDSLFFYGQFGMSELTIPFEGNASNPPPNSTAYLAGFKYSHSFNSWRSIFYLESIYTDPYWNMLSSPYASFMTNHTMYTKDRNNSNKKIIFLGYPRDTFVISAGTLFNNQKNLNLRGCFSWIAKGEKDKDKINWDWELKNNIPKSDLFSPTGIVQNNFVLSLGAEWLIIHNLGIDLNFTGIHSLNYNHIKSENKTNGQITFTIFWNL